MFFLLIMTKNLTQNLVFPFYIKKFCSKAFPVKLTLRCYCKTLSNSMSFHPFNKVQMRCGCKRSPFILDMQRGENEMDIKIEKRMNR